MHFHIEFHDLTLMRGSCYIELPEWLARNKTVINPKNDYGYCFKWAVIAALHHKEIVNNPDHFLNL